MPNRVINELFGVTNPNDILTLAGGDSRYARIGNVQMAWGNILGSLANQTDLKAALDSLQSQITSSGANGTWGNISGTLSSQTDLQNALNSLQTAINGKADASALSAYVTSTSLASSLSAYVTSTSLTSTLSGYATTSALTSGLAGKASTATFTSTVAGLVPASGGGTSNFLRSDGQWIAVTGGGGTWGSISGTLSNQTDLQTALNAKEPTITAGSTAQYWRGDKSWQTLNAAAVGLGNVTNVAQEPAITAGLTTQYWRGDKTWQTLDKAAVGLANVDNTSDANKPVSTSQQTALNLKANLTGATFSGAIGATNLSGTNTGDQTITLTGDVTGSGTGSFATAIGTNKVTRAMLAQTAGATLLGATAAGNVADLTAAQAKTFLAIATGDVSGLATVATTGSAADLTGTLAAARLPAFSGDVSSTAGTATLSIGSNKVTNAMLSQVASGTFKGRTSASVGSVEDLTVAQATALLNVYGGATGVAGGTKGLVPAPVIGDFVASAYLKSDGTWSQVQAANVNGLAAIASSGSGADLTTASVTLGKLAAQANNTLLGNISGGSTSPSALTMAQVAAALPAFTSSAQGLAPASGGGTANFLRADGTWVGALPLTGGTLTGALNLYQTENADVASTVAASTQFVHNSHEMVAYTTTGGTSYMSAATVGFGIIRIQGTLTSPALVHMTSGTTARFTRGYILLNETTGNDTGGNPWTVTVRACDFTTSTSELTVTRGGFKRVYTKTTDIIDLDANSTLPSDPTFNSVTLPSGMDASNNNSLAATTQMVHSVINFADYFTTGGTTTLDSSVYHSAIRINGTLTSNATVNFWTGVSTASMSRIYTIRNNTTGAFTLTLQPIASGATTSIQITQGNSATVLVYGTDIYDITPTQTVTSVPIKSESDSSAAPAATATVHAILNTPNVAPGGGATTLDPVYASKTSVRFTGALTTNATVSFWSGSTASLNRIYIVRNDTTGAFTLTLQACTTSPASTISVAQGSTAIVRITNNTIADITPAGAGGGGTTSFSLTFNNGGSGAASGTTFDGSTARTISYNTLGAAPLASPTFTGKVTTAASATGGAGLNLPHGAAPTSPTNGDVWTTTSALFARINGATTQMATGTGTATGTNTGDQTITLTGDVTGSGTGSFATAIGANKVTRAMMAATAGATILGATAAGNVADLTAAQAKTFLAIAKADVSGLSNGLTASMAGTPAASMRMVTIAPYSVTLTQANCSGSALTAATASTVFTLKKGTIASPTTIGTWTFAAAGTTATVSITNGSITAGDNVWWEAPSTMDSTIADIALLAKA